MEFYHCSKNKEMLASALKVSYTLSAAAYCLSCPSLSMVFSYPLSHIMPFDQANVGKIQQVPYTSSNLMSNYVQ